LLQPVDFSFTANVKVETGVSSFLPPPALKKEPLERLFFPFGPSPIIGDRSISSSSFFLRYPCSWFPLLSFFFFLFLFSLLFLFFSSFPLFFPPFFFFFLSFFSHFHFGIIWKCSGVPMFPPLGGGCDRFFRPLLSRQGNFKPLFSPPLF